MLKNCRNNYISTESFFITQLPKSNGNTGRCMVFGPDVHCTCAMLYLNKSQICTRTIESAPVVKGSVFMLK